MQFTLRPLLEQRQTSILTPVIGVAVQVLTWPVLFLIGVDVHRDPPALFKALSMAWFFIPLLSLFGCYAGARYAREHGNDPLAIAGVGLNLLWFALFALVCHLVFNVGITV